MAAFTLIPVVVLLVGLVLAAVVLGLVKLAASPQAWQVVKILILAPLLLVGLLVLAFVVLTVTYRVSREQSPAIRVDEAANGAKVSVSSHEVVVKSSRVARASVAANETFPPASAPAAFAATPKGNSASGIAGLFRAMNKAFVAATRSMVANDDSAGRGSPQPRQGSSPAASGSSQGQPAVAASASSPAAPMAAPRPDWVDNPPQPRAELYELAVKAGPWRTPLDCEQELDEKIAWAVDSYVAWRIDEEAASQVQLPEDYAREHLVKEQWLEKIHTSLGEMYNLHALLSFDRLVEGKLQDIWNQFLLGARLLLSAAILGGVLLILTVIYGYLKIDLATAGTYRGRLRFVTAAVVLALAAAGAAFWRHSPGQ